jgi:protein-S-isoprenylcysteine O-methyltransferase Ste14
MSTNLLTNPTAKLAIGFLNAWLLCVPLLLPGIFVGVVRKDVAKRMSDMTGYSAKEKFFTVAASIAPYPFVVLTLWTPFTKTKALFGCGLAVYLIGIATLLCTLYVFANTPADQPIVTGPYRWSRNPFYVSAGMVFLGICLATANPLLLGILLVLLVLQHFMILAEERACQQKYGALYAQYAKRVPRYLAMF